MGRLNDIMRNLISEMWAVKNNPDSADVKDVLDFYKTYHSCANLASDLLNTKIVCNSKEDYQNDEDLIIGIFQSVFGYKYDRLLIDSLLELDSNNALGYLRSILLYEDTSNREKFIDDFCHHPSFAKVMALIDEK